MGKTTIAWTTALACAQQGLRVKVASWRPYEEGDSSGAISHQNISPIHLTTLSAFREYTLKVVRFEKIYDTIFDNPVLRTFILATPGLSETVIAGKIWDVWNNNEADLLIVDLPSSGHAKSFFQSPLGVLKVFRMGVVHRNTEKICEMFADPQTRLDLVAIPEELPITEAAELRRDLADTHPFSFGFLHVNRVTPHFNITNPSSEPQLVQETIQRYHQRQESEQKSIEDGQKLGMDLLRWERLATSQQSETIHALAAKIGGE